MSFNFGLLRVARVVPRSVILGGGVLGVAADRSHHCLACLRVLVLREVLEQEKNLLFLQERRLLLSLRHEVGDELADSLARHVFARRRLLASHALVVPLLLDGGGRFFGEKAAFILGVCKVGTRFLGCQILLLLVQRLELAEN